MAAQEFFLWRVAGSQTVLFVDVKLDVPRFAVEQCYRCVPHYYNQIEAQFVAGHGAYFFEIFYYPHKTLLHGVLGVG